MCPFWFNVDPSLFTTITLWIVVISGLSFATIPACRRATKLEEPLAAIGAVGGVIGVICASLSLDWKVTATLAGYVGLTVGYRMLDEWYDKVQEKRERERRDKRYREMEADAERRHHDFIRQRNRRMEEQRQRQREMRRQAIREQVMNDTPDESIWKDDDPC